MSDEPTGNDNMDFMAGYYRDPTSTGKLLSALVKSMEKHPSLRLGQLLVAVMSKRTGGNNITDALFTIYDEELIRLLDEFSKEQGVT